MISIIATLIIFGLIITIHEWGHFAVAKRQGIHVETFSIGFGPSMYTYKYNGTVYKISLFPLGGYVKMSGDDPSVSKKDLKETDFFAKTPWQRIKVALAGPAMNYILAYVLLLISFLVGFQTHGTTIDKVLKDSFAEKAGLIKGDKILKINQVPVFVWRDVIVQLRLKKKNSKIILSILRDQEKKNCVIDTNGIVVDKIGIAPGPKNKLIRYSFFKAFLVSFQSIIDHTYGTILMFKRLISRDMSFKKSVSGPLGIVVMTHREVQNGYVALLQFTAFLSIALGFFNLLPIPVLDGGHIFLFLLEWIFKKPIPLKLQNIVQTMAISVLLLLTLVVFYFDISKLKLNDRVKKLWTKDKNISVSTGKTNK